MAPTYKLFHADSESSPRHLLYRGSEPRAKDMLLPSGERWIWAQVEDKFGMRNTSFVGTFTLQEKHLNLSFFDSSIM